jgi:hypothetical protein
MMFHRIGLACAFMLLCASAIADSWNLRASQRTYHFRNGLRIVVTNDAARIPRVPRYHVRIYHGRRLRVQHDHLGFEVLAASPDQKTFVGISNHGFPGTAAVVFDRNGRILLQAWHSRTMNSVLRYCQQSMTVRRHWFDEENPELQFGPDGSIDSITLRGCHGDRIRLVEELDNGLKRIKAQEDEERVRWERLNDQFIDEQLKRDTAPAKP